MRFADGTKAPTIILEAGDADGTEDHPYLENEIPNVSKLTTKSGVPLADGGAPEMTVEIKYEPSTEDDEHKTGGTVTWTITNAPAQAYGYVELTVRVNANAMQGWQYEDGTDLSSGLVIMDDENNVSIDNKVINGASVTANEVTRTTNIVENPTGENTKTEITPGNGMQVTQNDEVFYEIGWSNSTNEKQTITIQDRLDPGVYFSRAWVMAEAGRSDSIVDS